MSYFTKFPKAAYTLDNYRSAQVTPDIFKRVKFSIDLVNNFAAYDEYDVQDGETPEIVADLFYNDPTLHWVILHANEVVDPRFEWPLSQYNLLQFVEGKYGNASAIHHYEDTTGNVTNGNVIITSAAAFGSFGVDSVITNATNTGTAVVTSKPNVNALVVLTTNGGFRAGDTIALSTNASITANITATSAISGTAVTNYQYEDKINESRRRIKILKAEVVGDVINEFESTIRRWVKMYNLLSKKLVLLIYKP